MKCDNCKKKVESVKSAVVNGVFLSKRCNLCLNNSVEANPMAAKYKRDRQREKHRKDIIQRYDGTEINKEFVRAYPEQAREQFGDEVMRELGA